jgi:hypothetical protein
MNGPSRKERHMDTARQSEPQPAEAEGHEVALTNLEQQESRRESKRFWRRPLLLKEHRCGPRQSWLLITSVSHLRTSCHQNNPLNNLCAGNRGN